MNDSVKDFTKFLCQDDVNVDSCVLAILTHGKKGDHLYGVDGNTVDMATIVKMFDGKNCPKMIGKPKLFIIQACRGGE